MHAFVGPFTVYVDGEVVGNPHARVQDARRAAEMLKRQGGKSHVLVVDGNKCALPRGRG